MKRTFWFPLGLGMMALAAACTGLPGVGLPGRVAGAPTPTALPPLPTREVAARQTVAADGALVLSVPPVAIAFDTTGRVVTVNVQAGQKVKKGDVLGVLDEQALQDALSQARESLALTEAQVSQQVAGTPSRQSDIDSAQASLNQAWAAYADLKKQPTDSAIEQALRTWNQAKNTLWSTQISRDKTCGNPLLGKDGPDCKAGDANVGAQYEAERGAYQRYLDAQKPATAAQLAQAWASVSAADARLKQLTESAPTTAETRKLLETQVLNARAVAQRAERNLARSKLIAPCNCTVQDVNIAVGSIASGPAMTLVDASSVVFRTNNLGERDLGAVRVGATASVRLKPYDKAFPGKVSAILPQSSGVQGNVAIFTVVVALDPATDELLPGMTGQVEIIAK